MPTDAALPVVLSREPAATRGIRMAVGTAATLVFAEALGWPNSFIAPLLTAMLLSLPIPAPTLTGGLKFVLVIAVSLGLGLLLIPLLEYAAGAGLVLLTLLLFGSFVYAARGGNPLVGAFLTMGLTVVPVIGSESSDTAMQLTVSFLQAIVIALPFVWLAHLVFPDADSKPEPQPAAAPGGPPAEAPSIAEVGRSGLRSIAVVMPMILWFFMASGTAGYAGVMMKVASMGQQASADHSRDVGKAVLLSTLIGGVAAVLFWWLLKIWPTLLVYGLLTMLAALVFAPRIFAGAGLAPTAPVWSYAFTTMLVILCPAVADSESGAAAGARFTDRIIMFVIATLYGALAVFLFDRFWPEKASRTVT